MLPKNELKRIIEALLMAAVEPLSADDLRQLLGDETSCNTQELQKLITELTTEYQGRGIELQQVASGYRFQICTDLASWASKLWEEKPPRYSRALLETLAVIAYKQPLTRAC